MCIRLKDGELIRDVVSVHPNGHFLRIVTHDGTTEVMVSMFEAFELDTEHLA
jgi:hypothetical protein